MLLLSKNFVTLDLLLEAIFASASVPGLFKPTDIENKNYVDGTARESVAFNSAVECGARKSLSFPASHFQ